MISTEPTESTSPYVVLVTGSRRQLAELRALVHRELDTVLDRAQADGRHLVVRHGACRTGADHYAGEWVAHQSLLRVTEERHPANWTGPCESDCDHGPRLPSASGRSRCPAAGPRRNLAMIGLEADQVLAFPVGHSPGTRGCMRLAAAVGLPVHVPAELRIGQGVA